MIAGVHKGARRKWGRMPLTAMPSKAQWASHLAQPATLGGWNAREVDTSMPGFGCNMSNTPITRRHREDAIRDFCALRASLQRGALRKAVPDDEVPTEVWRLLFSPHAVFSLVRFGLGHNKKFDIASLATQWIHGLLACIRATGQTPSQFQCSVGHCFHKSCKPHISDEGLCTDVRVVHAFGALAN